MTENPEGGFAMYAQLLLESITKLACQTEELKKQYADLDKSISLLKQAYEVNLLADRHAMKDLIAEVKRITLTVEGLPCRDHTEKIGSFKERIEALEAGIIPSKWAARFISQFFQKVGWIFGALIVGSIGFILYLVAMTVFQH